MTHTTITILIAISSINAGILYSMYRYFDSVVNDIYNLIDHSEQNGRFGLDCEKKVINDRIDKNEERFTDYVHTSTTKAYDLEIHKLRDELQNNALCCQNGINRVIRDIVDLKVEMITPLDNAMAKIATDMAKLTKKIEGSKSMVVHKKENK